MSKKQSNDFSIIKNHSSIFWLLFFFILVIFLFLLRGLLFGKYGWLDYSLVGDTVPLLLFLLLLFAISVSPIIFRMISLEKKQNKRMYGFFKESVGEHKDLDVFYLFILFFIPITVFYLWINTMITVSALIYLSTIFLLLISLFSTFIISVKSISKIIDILRSASLSVGETKSLKQLFAFCIESESFKYLIIFLSFVAFWGVYLLDILNRSTDETMVAFYIMLYLFIISVFIASFLFIGMLIATKGIKKSFLAKFLFFISTIAMAIFFSYAFFRILWFNFYL